MTKLTVPYRALVILLCSAAGIAPAAAIEVSSPDGELVFALTLNERGTPQYAMTYRGRVVVRESQLGLRFLDHPHLDRDLEITGSETGSANERWEQPWGERRVVTNRHNELLVHVAREDGTARYGLRVRVFDDGVGFRYEVPDQPGFDRVDVVDELTEFHIADGAMAWYTPGGRFNRYEYIYETTPLVELQTAHTPMTMRLPDGTHLSIHEAALVDYAAFVLDQRRPYVLQADLTPWSDGIRVKTEAPFRSSWRTIQVAPDAVGLINSELILNLNEPNKLGDVSWVEPGKYIGIWWAMHIGTATWGSGPKHGATTENTKRHMDFAAEHGFDGVLVEGWNVGWDGDWFWNGDLFRFDEPYPDFDIAEVTEYGKQLGVRLIGHHETSGNVTNYALQMDAAFDFYEAHGVTQVKTGYVADASDIKRVDERGMPHYEWHDGQFMVNEYLKSVTEAAKRQISINTHEPIKDTGLRRTYPNWVTREGARGQEFNAWGVPPNPPEHTAILPFTRMLAGPMDFTPGIFNLTFDGALSRQRVQTTLAKQLSLYVVIYSPLQMAADLPENYEANPEPFRFIVDVPADWEQSIAVAGEVGDFVAIARRERGGDDWYLGALTDEKPRTLSIPLTFLDRRTDYVAEIYRDGDNAHWWTDPYDIVIESRPVTARDTLTLPLAASGGAAVRFRAE